MSELENRTFCQNCKLEFSFEASQNKVPKNCPRCGCGVYISNHLGDSAIPTSSSPTFVNTNDVVKVQGGRPLTSPGKL